MDGNDPGDFHCSVSARIRGAVGDGVDSRNSSIDGVAADSHGNGGIAGVGDGCTGFGVSFDAAFKVQFTCSDKRDDRWCCVLDDDGAGDFHRCVSARIGGVVGDGVDSWYGDVNNIAADVHSDRRITGISGRCTGFDVGVDTAFQRQFTFTDQCDDWRCSVLHGNGASDFHCSVSARVGGVVGDGIDSRNSSIDGVTADGYGDSRIARIDDRCSQFGVCVDTAFENQSSCPDEHDDRWCRVHRRRWVLPLVLIAGFPPVLFIAVPALLVLAVWVPVRRSVVRSEDVPVALGVAIRGVWLAIAVAGMVALVLDVGELA